MCIKPSYPPASICITRNWHAGDILTATHTTQRCLASSQLSTYRTYHITRLRLQRLRLPQCNRPDRLCTEIAVPNSFLEAFSSIVRGRLDGASGHNIAWNALFEKKNPLFFWMVSECREPVYLTIFCLKSGNRLLFGTVLLWRRCLGEFQLETFKFLDCRIKRVWADADFSDWNAYSVDIMPAAILNSCYSKTVVWRSLNKFLQFNSAVSAVRLNDF